MAAGRLVGVVDAAVVRPTPVAVLPLPAVQMRPCQIRRRRGVRRAEPLGDLSARLELVARRETAGRTQEEGTTRIRRPVMGQLDSIVPGWSRMPG